MLPYQTFIADRGIDLAFMTFEALSIPVYWFFIYQIRRNPNLAAASGQATSQQGERQTLTR